MSRSSAISGKNSTTMMRFPLLICNKCQTISVVVFLHLKFNRQTETILYVTCTSCMMPLKFIGVFVISDRFGIASTWRMVRPIWGMPPRYSTFTSSGPVAEIVLRKYSVPFIFTWTSVMLRTTLWKHYKNNNTSSL